MSKRRRKLFDDDSKVYKICSVLGGLDVTRYVSAHTRQLFQGAIEDVELIREYVSQSASERNNKAKPYDMDKMAHTFQWKRRGFDSPTTSIEAGQGYVDDSPDRSIEACFLQNKNHPLVGTQASDMAMIHTVSYLFPWIVDRRSKEGWIRHQNGRSDTQPLLFDTLYTAAWIGTYGEAWAYYPPFRVFDDHHPLNLIDVMGNLLDTHDLPFVKPNLPSVGNNNRKAFFRNPYPDTAQLGLSLISALAPVYYTGKFGNNTYNDTYIASTGVDIPVSSVSSLLDVLRDRLTQDSFAILVDSDFNTIVISQEVVERIYPRRTGFEESRVSYDTRDGSMIGDRRNQTYLVSDTIFQPLTSLTNANWTGLLDFIREDVRRGDRDYSTLNITLTSEKEPTEFYVMLERWKYVADWILLSFAPTHQVEHAIDVSFSTTNDNSLTHEQHSTRIYLAGERGHPLSGQAMIVNSGTLDVRVGIKNIPRCIQFQNKTQMLEKESLTAGNTLPLEFHIRTDDLELGVSSMLLAFSVQDDQYPDCFYNQDLNLEVVVRVTPIDCVAATGIQRLVWSEAKHNCVCQRDTIPVSGGYCLSYFLVLPIVLVVLVVLGLIGVHVYVEQKRQQADSVWAVKTAELQFDDPPEVVGRGTFGLVLLAEYRGTQVAVKRVIPPQEQRKEKRGKVKNRRNSANYFDMQAEKTSSGEYSIVEDGGLVSSNSLASGRMTRSKRRTSRRSSMRNSNAEYARLKNEFTYEMRLLSKLRHPCITTVMGAVISEDPLLVMEYMDHGSLFDLLHNETMIIEGDIVLPILRDIAQGVRFLHAAEPQVIHGDLKAQNVLVDGKFRAKVTDFGLSQKKQVGVAGTPLWMAPELLRGESNNSAASDVYSFGVILYEVYARKIPYEGHNLDEVLKLVADPIINKRPPIPPSMPAGVSSLMSDCLDGEPKARPTFSEIDLRIKRFNVVSVEPGRMITSHRQTKAGGGAMELKKATDLLYEIFPKHVAEALQDGRRVEPESFECVTIFFSDIVGFTTISGSMSPVKVSDLLDRLYLKFDALSRKHDIFKVETIGDAWMGVTNVTHSQPDHTKRIAQFAIDAIAAANATLINTDEPDRGYVQIRVGFHSGPVIANVVGSRNPHYSLIGDTVNTSSRMESNSEPGRILCSERAASLLMQQQQQQQGMESTASPIPVAFRGKIEVKGKGGMRTYWVNEENDETDDSCSDDDLYASYCINFDAVADEKTPLNGERKHGESSARRLMRILSNGSKN